MVPRLQPTVLALLFAAGCGLGGGGGGGDTANGSVSGQAGGRDFTFVPAQVRARFDASVPTEGDLTVALCETPCPATGARSVTLMVNGDTGSIRSGATFRVGPDALANAAFPQSSSTQVEDAVSGEVVIQSTDLKVGGTSIGTFDLGLSGGGAISGFFEAILTEVNGPVASL